MESKTVGSDWIVLNPGFKCHIILEVVGAEMLFGEPNNYIRAKPGEQLGNVTKSRGVRIIAVRTVEGVGRINYVLHPHGCVERGWYCVQ
jgi:hypothetical protein